MEQVVTKTKPNTDDEKHRAKIENETFMAIWSILDELNPYTALGTGKSNCDITNLIVSRIKEKEIPNVTINY